MEVKYVAEGTRVPARLEDLSEGGAYIDTPHPLYVGTPMTLELELPASLSAPDPEPVHLDAEVVWTRNGLGAGVAFYALSGDARARLRFYVASVFFGHL